MRTALGEQVKTMAFSVALPVSLSRQAWVRVLGAAAALAIPAIIGALVLSIVLFSGLVWQAEPVTDLDIRNLPVPERPTLSGMAAVEMTWRISAIAFSSSFELLLLISILGAGLRAEAHVGFWGACVSLAWVSLTDVRIRNPVTHSWLGAILPQTLVINFGYTNYTDLYTARSAWLALQLGVAGRSAAWFNAMGSVPAL